MNYHSHLGWGWLRAPEVLSPGDNLIRQLCYRADKNTTKHLTFPEASTSINSFILTTFWDSYATIIPEETVEYALLIIINYSKVGRELAAFPRHLVQGQTSLMNEREEEQFSTSMQIRNSLPLPPILSESPHKIPDLKITESCLNSLGEQESEAQPRVWHKHTKEGVRCAILFLTERNTALYVYE